MESWVLASIILAAIFVGALLPVLFLLAATLNAARRRIQEGGGRFNELLERLHKVAAQLEEASQGLEGSKQVVRDLVATADDLTQVLRSARKGFRVAAALGTAVGPAAAAFVNGLTSDGRPEGQSVPTERERQKDKKQKGERDE